MNADLAKGHSRCLRPASASWAIDEADYFYISFFRVGPQQPFGKLNNCALTTDFARNVLCGQLVPIAGWRECERSSRRKLTLRPFSSGDMPRMVKSPDAAAMLWRGYNRRRPV